MKRSRKRESWLPRRSDSIFGASAPTPCVCMGQGPALATSLCHPERSEGSRRLRCLGRSQALATLFLLLFAAAHVSAGASSAASGAMGAATALHGRLMTERYLLAAPMAKLYAIYGCLAVAAGLALAAPRRRAGLLGGLALGVAFVPVGLAIAAPIPPGHDALYLAASFAVAIILSLLGAAAGRAVPARGLALGMLLGAAVLVSDILAGSPLMRFSALEMGIMMGSRFYGIGNEYMGALVGMTVIGLGAWLQLSPRSGKIIALVGAFIALVIGAPFWGANWGGSATAAVGLISLWLLSSAGDRKGSPLRKAWASRAGVAALALAASVIVPAALDLLNAPSNRSHIGTAAAALLSGDTAGLSEIISRKAGIALRVVRTAPWSIIGAVLCAFVFWLQLRSGAPARRALQGQRALAAGIAAAVSAGAIAMLVNDSGPAAGMGAIFAGLGSVVYLSSVGLSAAERATTCEGPSERGLIASIKS